MTDQTTAITLIPNSEIAEETWNFDDYRHGLCRHGQIGTPRVDAGKVRRLARAHAGAAIQTLAMIASQTKDMPSALRAIQMLLDRGFGRPEVASLVDAPTELPKAEEEWPEWLTHRRHAYQEAPPTPDAPEPSEALPAPPPPPEAPAPAPASRGAVREPLRMVPPSPPAFYDSPTQPAQGSYRDPPRAN